MIVDEMHHEHPELIRDQYWDEVFPSELPYTIATGSFHRFNRNINEIAFPGFRLGIINTYVALFALL